MYVTRLDPPPLLTLQDSREWRIIGSGKRRERERLANLHHSSVLCVYLERRLRTRQYITSVKRVERYNQHNT